MKPITFKDGARKITIKHSWLKTFWRKIVRWAITGSFVCIAIAVSSQTFYKPGAVRQREPFTVVGSSITANAFFLSDGTQLGTAGSVDTSKIATDAVTSAKIINAAINTAKLASDAVITEKILTAAVTTPKIANSAVDTSKLASDSVTGSKILDRTIDTNKLNADIQAQLSAGGGSGITQLTGDVTAGPGSGSQAATIAAGVVDTGKIATDSVTGVKILNATIDTGKLNSTIQAQLSSIAPRLRTNIIQVNEGTALSGDVTAESPNPPISMVFNGVKDWGLVIVATAANANSGANILQMKTRSTGNSGDGNTIVVSGDVIGGTDFYGSDGVNYEPAASIYAAVDGTPGSNDMPGRLTFNTTADGSASVTERMRITSAGLVGIGSTSPCSTCTLQVISASGSGVDIVGNLAVTGSLSLAAGVINTAKLATDSVTGSKILDQTIDTNKLNLTIQQQLAAAGSGGTGLYHASFSSWTYPGGSGTAYTNTTFSVARDTLTWTSTAASSYTVVAMIAFSHSAANDEGYLWVLINGNFISGNSGSVQNCEGDSNGTDQFGQMTCVIPIPQLAAGTHTVSFGLGTRNGTLTGPRRRSVFGIIQN